MKIVADENIPLLESLFGPLGDVTSLPGANIDPAALADADALVVRSVTRVDARLLDATKVSFVGSATAGIDHVDRAYLDARGIRFAHAPGSNADSVCDYVVSTLLELGAITATSLRGLTLGIVGVGAVGGRLARRARALGMNLLQNDPPRCEAEPELQRDPSFVEIGELLAASDVVSLHVPLQVAGPHATHHLIGSDQLKSLKPTAWLLNTSRGPVVDSVALAESLERTAGIQCVLDVWEGEPNVPADLMSRVTFGTPHIAGYAYDGKVAGAVTVARALAQMINAPLADRVAALTRVQASAATRGAPASDDQVLLDVARSFYDFREDYRRFASTASLPHEERAARFRMLRRDYPRRRGFEAFDLSVPAATDASLLAALSGGLNARLMHAQADPEYTARSGRQ